MRNFNPCGCVLSFWSTKETKLRPTTLPTSIPLSCWDEVKVSFSVIYDITIASKNKIHHSNPSNLLQPRPGGTWNIQCQHGTFVPEVEHRIFDKDVTLFTTILRSPVDHFVSAFRFFGLEKRVRKVINC